MAYFAGIITMVCSTIVGTSMPAELASFGSAVLPAYLKIAPQFQVLLQSSALPFPEALNGINRTTVGSLPEFDVEYPQLPASAENQSSDQQWIGASSGFETRQQEVQQKDTHSVLKNFLPSFLALISLKNAVLDYYLGAKSSSSSNLDDDLEHHGDLDIDSPFDPSHVNEFCSVGPCLMDSWPNCWNVSSFTDWTDFQRCSATCCKDYKPCCSKCVRNLDTRRSKTVDRRDDDGLIKCCCKQSASWFQGSLSSAIIDLNLRFSTQTLYPIYVTT